MWYNNTEYYNSSTKIFINGDWCYYTINPEVLYKNLVKYKRSGIINIYTSISFKIELNEIHIFTDAGRCCRPLYIVEDNKLIFHKGDYEDYKDKIIAELDE